MLRDTDHLSQADVVARGRDGCTFSWLLTINPGVFTCRGHSRESRRQFYDAEVTTLKFTAPDAVSMIDAWVNERTKSKISHILHGLSPLAAMVVVNAIYFKGRWAIPFNRELTRDGLFTASTGQKKQLPMMRQSGMYSYYEDDESQAVVLCYEGDMALS